MHLIVAYRIIIRHSIPRSQSSMLITHQTIIVQRISRQFLLQKIYLVSIVEKGKTIKDR